MNTLAVTTCVNNDRFLYFSRVITFDFAPNGIRMPFFRQKNRKHS
ncbi:RAxF-45 family protein [Ureibacillus aquaedulcis]|uniref:RAxF-45 family protein n=1 Tax=Ureibacillus aquaedulcis TaxID=3058421 RepID=A0ABT8GMS6_9BACL|nr:RAxF-45 family protein [Ureibacillus sp. BA0131]MDN4492710.1 RAxF-45 family protein [Ureibacillus sp. BA0131]